MAEPTTKTDAEPMVPATKAAGVAELRAQLAQVTRERDELRAEFEDERRRTDPGVRMARALEITALLAVHQAQSALGTVSKQHVAKAASLAALIPDATPPAEKPRS